MDQGYNRRLVYRSASNRKQTDRHFVQLVLEAVVFPPDLLNVHKRDSYGAVVDFPDRIRLRLSFPSVGALP
jgi:hypothetical protein